MIDTSRTKSATTFTIGLVVGAGERREDPDRERLLRARGEDRHDDLVERQGEREQASGKQRGPQLRQQHVAEGLPGVGAEIGRRLVEEPAVDGAAR